MAEPARSPTARPVVVVGYDGSPAADAALERGLDQTLDGGRLYVVYAWEPPRVLSGATYYGIVAAGSLEHARAMMDDLAERHPRLREARASVSVREGRAPDVIADLAEEVDADEIVVGTRGAGRAGALMGSVAHGLLHTARCPVTVIPERALRRTAGRAVAGKRHQLSNFARLSCVSSWQSGTSRSRSTLPGGFIPMKLNAKLAVIPAALALAAAPALAVAAPPSDHPTGPPSTVSKGKPADTPSGQSSATPGPKASLPAKAKAYGVYCRSESKKHVAGAKGTPFSQCVTAMAKLANGKTNSARSACKAESKKHVKGQKGTPFSQCVSAAAKLKDDQSSGSDDDSSSSSS